MSQKAEVYVSEPNRRHAAKAHKHEEEDNTLINLIVKEVISHLPAMAPPSPAPEVDMEAIKQRVHNKFDQYYDNAATWGYDEIRVDDIVCQNKNEFLVLQSYRKSLEEKAADIAKRHMSSKSFLGMRKK